MEDGVGVLQPKIAVIVPSLNEERHIEGTLRSILSQDTPVEVVVVDGGSTDRSPEIARTLARVISGTRGRARQMNEGARHTSGDILVFLHADTRMPPGYCRMLLEVRQREGVVGGFSPMDFDSSSPLLNFYARLTRTPAWFFHYGDQAFFVRREIFEEMGGFAEMPIMEDLDFLNRLRRKGRLVLLPVPVITSARRFLEGGVLRTQMRNVLLVLLFVLGVNPTLLKRFYPDTRGKR
jgi:rSAM/selenodomain-associated transferase 2